jgi:LPS-assembly protein
MKCVVDFIYSLILRLGIGLLLAFGLLPGFCLADDLIADLSQSDLPVKLDADQLDFDEHLGVYRAAGAVHLASGLLDLRADKIEYSVRSGQANAEGGVVLITPEGSMQGEKISVNLQSGLGALDKGKLFLKQSHFYLTGNQIERLDTTTYRIQQGTFTVCDANHPDWKFAAKDLVIDINGYAKGKNGVFYLGDLPVFYTPALLYPVKQERNSGLLTPEVGYSEKRGAEIGLAWYWAIARNQDMTYYLDYLSELGLGQGLEYRYVFAEENEGEAFVYQISGLKNATDRYAIRWLHSGSLAPRVRLAADVEYVSSRDYFEDFGRVADDYTKEKAESVVMLSRHWDSVNLSGQLKYVQDLERENDETLQRLPEIHLDLLRQQNELTGLHYGLESSVTHFWRELGERGERIAFRPFLAAVFQPGQLLEFEPEVGYTYRAYLLDKSASSQETAGIADFSARVSTRLSRVYQPGWHGIDKLRHSIEPDIKYLFVPDEPQTDLPLFDGLDRIEHANLLSYGITNRFTVRQVSETGTPQYHEFLYARLSQEFDVEESRRDPLDPTDSRKPFSSLRLEMIARPNDSSYLDFDARFDPNRDVNEFTMFNATGGIQDADGNALKLDYRYTRDSNHYLSGEIELAWLDPVYLRYLQRYDFREQANLEQVIDLEYRAQCWNLSLVYRDRLEDSEYLVTFALTGIGQLARFGGNLNTPAPAAQ